MSFRSASFCFLNRNGNSDRIGFTAFHTNGYRKFINVSGLKWQGTGLTVGVKSDPLM